MLDLTLTTQAPTRLRLLDDFKPTVLLTRQSSHRGQPETMDNKHWPIRAPNSALVEEVEMIDAIYDRAQQLWTSDLRSSCGPKLKAFINSACTRSLSLRRT